MHNRGQHIEMEDAEIVALYWDRNEAAIAASEDKYGAYCNTISYNITASLEDSEECVNETWLRAWNIIPPDRPLRLTAFFGKIVRNLSLDRLRRKNAMRRGGGNVCLALEELEECIPAEHDVEQQVLVGELAQLINEFLKKLPVRPRVCAFTATATDKVRNDIKKLLKLKKPFEKITGFNRSNLYFRVLQPENKRDALFELMENFRGMSGIVYCATRKLVEEVYGLEVLGRHDILVLDSKLLPCLTVGNLI